MTRRNMILAGLVIAMLGAIMIGYGMHQTAPLPATQPPASDGTTGGEPVSGSRY